MLAAPTSRPWQRHVRFGVRGLTVLVGVIGAGLGWLVRGARIQHEAVAAIEQARPNAGPAQTEDRASLISRQPA